MCAFERSREFHQPPYCDMLGICPSTLLIVPNFPARTATQLTSKFTSSIIRLSPGIFSFSIVTLHNPSHLPLSAPNPEVRWGSPPQPVAAGLIACLPPPVLRRVPYCPFYYCSTSRGDFSTALAEPRKCQARGWRVLTRCDTDSGRGEHNMWILTKRGIRIRICCPRRRCCWRDHAEWGWGRSGGEVLGAVVLRRLTCSRC